MNRSLLTLGLLVSLLAAYQVANAQYLFTDTNGDGVFSSSDRLNPTGTTTLTIWLRTDQNKDGTKSVCAANAAQDLSIFSYEVILHATGGAVKWGTYTNLLSGMVHPFGSFANAADFYVGFGGEAPLPPGKYRLGTLVVSTTSGSPTIAFAASTPIWPALHTSFGSMCAGRAGHNTVVFADAQTVTSGGGEVVSDWTDADAISVANGTVQAAAAKPGSQDQAVRPDGISPNPLNPNGLITFSMKQMGMAQVSVYDTQGRLVKVLLPKQLLSAGSHSVTIDGLDRNGKHLSSGVYFYDIQTPDGETRGRFVVMK